MKKKALAIKDIFAENGEKYFRDLETQALRDLQEEKETIISCGGGAVLRDEKCGNTKYWKCYCTA